MLKWHIKNVENHISKKLKFIKKNIGILDLILLIKF